MGQRTQVALSVLGLSFSLGVLADALFQGQGLGVNVLLWTAAFVGALAALIRPARAPLRQGRRFFVAPALLFSALFVWHDSTLLVASNLFALAAAVAIAGLRRPGPPLAKTRLGDYLGGFVATGAATAAGPIPLIERDVAWPEVWQTARSSRTLAVGRGLALTAPLLVLFGALFVAADAVFEDLISNLFAFDIARLLGHIFLFALFAWISAGLLRLALVGGEFPPVQRPPYLRLGIVELGVALGLLNALFSLFVLVQVRYLFGGADQVLSSTGLTYAEYARRGFFELVTVTALAVPLLLFAHWLLRTDKRSHVLLFALLAGSLVGLLFVVMASALQRMRLYAEAFGLTELRLYTTAFMFWIFAVLVWYLLTVLRNRRERFAFGTLVTGFVAVAVLNILNPDALIVRTNVARMENGRTFDAPYLASLSADAVPPLLASLGAMGEGDRRTVEEALRSRWTSSGADWRTYNLGRSRAQEMVDERS